RVGVIRQQGTADRDSAENEEQETRSGAGATHSLTLLASCRTAGRPRLPEQSGRIGGDLFPPSVVPFALDRQDLEHRGRARKSRGRQKVCVVREQKSR